MLKNENTTVFNSDRYKFNDDLKECISSFQKKGFNVVVTYSTSNKKYTALVTATKEIEGEQVELF